MTGLVRNGRERFRRDRLACEARPLLYTGDGFFIAKESPMVRFLSCFAALFVATASIQAQQPSRLDEIIGRGTLRVGMTGDYMPFTYLDKDTQKFRGFDVDMAEALGKALGVKVEYVQTAWPQLMKDFEAQKFDIAMGGVSITLDRQKKGLFSTPIMREGKTRSRAAPTRTSSRRSPTSTNRARASSSIPAAPMNALRAPTSRTPRSGSMATTSRSSTRSPRATPI
jgi:hypothetical protein